MPGLTQRARRLSLFSFSLSLSSLFSLLSSPRPQDSFVLHGPHINRRGIYKDSYGSSAGYTDYQLRPNVAVAMTVAPELFALRRARRCLDTMRTALLGGMGMRTLDPADMQYRPSYDNSNDGTVGTAARNNAIWHCTGASGLTPDAGAAAAAPLFCLGLHPCTRLQLPPGARMAVADRLFPARASDFRRGR